MPTLGERLAEERTRLGFNQPDFAALGGVKRTSQVNYEANARRPDADYLRGIAAAGADIQYVVTGVRSLNAGTAAGGVPPRAVDAMVIADILEALEDVAGFRGMKLTNDDRGEILSLAYPEFSRGVSQDEQVGVVVRLLRERFP